MSTERLAGLRFAQHPAMLIVRCATPAVTIFAMNRAGGPVTAPASWEPEDGLVTRPRLDVEVRRLPPGGAVFIESLDAGAALAEAVARGFEETPHFDAAANIAGMLEAGAFTSVVSGTIEGESGT